MKKCHYCGSTTADLRPYGPGGADVCFKCAMATPERKAQAEAAFHTMMDASAAMGDVIVLGGSSGPNPATVDDIIRLATEEEGK